MVLSNVLLVLSQLRSSEYLFLSHPRACARAALGYALSLLRSLTHMTMQSKATAYAKNKRIQNFDWKRDFKYATLEGTILSSFSLYHFLKPWGMTK